MTSLFDKLTGLEANVALSSANVIANQIGPKNTSNSNYYIYNNVTGEIIRLCDYDDADCNAALNAQGYMMLDPDQ